MKNRESALSDPIRKIRASLRVAPVGSRIICSVLAGRSSDAEGFDQSQSAAWEEALDFARAQRLLPLVHVHLAKQEYHVPQDAALAFRDSYYQHMIGNTRRYRAMLNVIQSLQSFGIELIVLKGAFISEVIYRNPAVRRSADLDILVRSTDLESATRGLVQLGYEPVSPIDFDGKFQDQHHRPHHLPGFHKQGSPLVEVHFNLAPSSGPFVIDIDRMWQRAQKVDLGHVSTLALDPIDLLLHVCIHTSYHHAFSFGLAQLYDIVAIIRYYGASLDWRAFIARAEDWRAAKSAYIALLLARGLLDAEVPDDVLVDLSPEDLEDDLRDWAVNQVLAQRTPMGEVEDDKADSNLVASPWVGFKRTIRSAFPSRQTMAYIYPVDDRPYLLPLYYVLRGFQMFAKYGRRSWAVLFGFHRRNEGIARKVAYHTFRNWLVD
jgi:hypothetical protein